ncbi:MAG: spondin domain-containing protein [Granulosicoccus sp.]
MVEARILQYLLYFVQQRDYAMSSTIQPNHQASINSRVYRLAAFVLVLSAFVSACSDSDSSSPNTSNTPETENNEPDVMGENTAESARYRLNFSAIWSPDTHPLNFPSNPHFSGLVGAVHNEQVIFWEPGQIASTGVQQVAERGRKADILTEVQAAIDAGTAQSAINGGGIGNSPGSVAIEFEVTQDFPEITVLSMIAPSPDWFVGLHNYSLIADGQFLDNATIDLVLYDSGSDDGLQYQSPNSASSTLSPITRLSSEAQDSPFVNGEPIVGTFSLERLP